MRWTISQTLHRPPGRTFGMCSVLRYRADGESTGARLCTRRAARAAEIDHHKSAVPIDAAFDVEQRVDVLDRFERDRRDRRRILPAAGIRRDVRQLEELPPSVRPTQCCGDRPLRA